MIGAEVETLAFGLRIRAGTAAEYKARHEAIWPEMAAALKEAGILHYEIHLSPADDLLFAFIVRRRDHAMGALREMEIFRRWQAHMADILVATEGEVRVGLEKVFELQ